jgi:hypothetical protein
VRNLGRVVAEAAVAVVLRFMTDLFRRMFFAVR